MKTVVCDAGPIIHLYEARCLPLLQRVGSIFISQRVYSEVQSVLHIENPWPEWLQIVQLALHEREEARIWQASGDLHAGEAEALVLARRKQADWFLTDDSATRLFISLLGMEVHGSLGVILWNAAHRHLSSEEAAGALNRLKASSLWLSERIYHEAHQSLDRIYGKAP
jgi:predicted nucleic acid-binding protein